jgi:ketosteroid isomerase-like protein
MSQENVEVVRAAWEAFQRRDNEAVFALYDPEVEVQHPVDGSLYRGFDGVRRFFQDWLPAWDDFEEQVEEWIEAGDHVVAFLHSRGRGKLSGVPVEQRQAHLWTVRGGKLWRLRIYPTKEAALEAAGLRE